MKPTIIIDAGHGGRDNGAIYDGRKEKDDNLDLALLVGQKLEEDGYPVFYTRTNDIYETPVTKAQIANASGGDYFVSFHRNAAATPGLYNGVQTLIYADNGISADLAKSINDKMVALGFKDLGVEERPDLAVLKRTTMPAVLIEAGFIDSDMDNELFDNQFNALADAIAVGIEEVVGNTAGGQGDINEEDAPYKVQVGLYRRLENAAYLLKTLEQKGYSAEIRQQGPYYVVYVGREGNVDDARELEKKLIQDKYDTLIVMDN